MPLAHGGNVRSKGIIAYGTEEDRQKLAELSRAHKKSGSQLLLEMIRTAHAKLKAEPQ